MEEYPIGGFAPGNYQCKCVTCGKYFIGDKRAVQCEPCAKNQQPIMDNEQRIKELAGKSKMPSKPDLFELYHDKKLGNRPIAKLFGVSHRTVSRWLKIYDIQPRRMGRQDTHGLWKSKEWNSWNHMRQRCLNPNHVKYADYGGRGITVCEEWAKSFEAFYTSMGKAPTKAHTLDRIDNSGNYEPSNCRWATPKQQANNTRRNKK